MTVDISAFDPSTFLDATMTQPLVKRPPLAVGPDYQGFIKDVKLRPWTSQKPDAKIKAGISLDIQIEIDVPVDQQARIGQPKVLLTDGAMLDLTDTNPPGLDMSPGKNRRVRQYREALNLNNPGDTFNFRMMVGKLIKVKIVQEIYQNEPVDNIGALAKA